MDPHHALFKGEARDRIQCMCFLLTFLLSDFLQVVSFTNMSKSSNKPMNFKLQPVFKIRLVATCHLQTCYNLLKQLVGFDNQLATSLFTICNRLVVNNLSQAMWTHRLVVTSCCKMSPVKKEGQRILTIYTTPYNIRPVSDVEFFMCRI